VSFLASPFGKASTHTSFTHWCDPPGGKHRQLARQVGVLRVFSPIFHSFLDGHSRFTDSALHVDLVREPRVHVYQFWLRHDPALGQRTGRSSHCASTIEGFETPSPPRFPAQEEAWAAPPSPLCLITTDSSCQAGGDTGANSPARRNRGQDGPTPQGSHDDDGRWRTLRALARRNGTSTRAIRPKKSIAVRPGQRRDIARQGDLSEHPNVRGETNGPPTRHGSTTTDVRAAGFLSGMRPPPPRSWPVHDHLTQATTAGGGTWMFLRRRARLRL